jgi:hypothetical protein
MFEQNKWQLWYDSLPASTKEYLSKQPIWHDRDLAKAFAVGILVGIVIGAII